MAQPISVIGLGKLGRGLATAYALRGFDVLGVDVLPEVVTEVNAEGRHGVRATLNHAGAITQTDISCIMVHTPSTDDGSFMNHYVLDAIEALGWALRTSGKAYHLFIVNSTVMPGTMEKEIIPLLELVSGRKVNHGFGLCYSPELVALGTVTQDFLNPDLVVIGASDRHAGQLAHETYERLCGPFVPVYLMSPINAELFKMALNAYVTMKISFANSLANMCEEIPGADVGVVTRALGGDSRIGPRFLRGGLSFGGTCFPRDTRAWKVLAKRHGLNAPLIDAVQQINSLQDDRLVKHVLQELGAKNARTLSVLGLSFKSGTDVIEESPAIKLIHEMLRYSVDVTVYDRLAIDNTRKVFGDRIHYAESVYDCVARSPVCVVTTTDAVFKKVFRVEPVKPVTVIDCWRLLDREWLGSNVRYVPLGVGG